MIFLLLVAMILLLLHLQLLSTRLACLTCSNNYSGNGRHIVLRTCAVFNSGHTCQSAGPESTLNKTRYSSEILCDLLVAIQLIPVSVSLAELLLRVHPLEPGYQQIAR